MYCRKTYLVLEAVSHRTACGRRCGRHSLSVRSLALHVKQETRPGGRVAVLVSSLTFLDYHLGLNQFSRSKTYVSVRAPSITDRNTGGSDMQCG